MNKNVLSKLSKIESNVELSDVKVDLALINDIQKAFDAANKELSIASNERKKAISSLDELFTAYRQNLIFSKQVNDIYNTMNIQAKDLGIELPANIQKMNVDALNNIKESESKMVYIKNVKQSI